MRVDRVLSKHTDRVRIPSFWLSLQSGSTGLSTQRSQKHKKRVPEEIPCKVSPVYRQLVVQGLVNSDPPEVSTKIVRLVRNMHEQVARRRYDQRSIDPSASNVALVMDNKFKNWGSL